MERNGDKHHDHPRPLFLKIAIPIAFSLTCFILSTITRNHTSTVEEDESMDSPSAVSDYKSGDEEAHEPDSLNHEDEEEEGEEAENEEVNTRITSLQQLQSTREISLHQSHDGPTTSEDIEGLKEMVSALEGRFYDYCNIKEQESNYQKLQIMCLGLKLESLESQNQRLEGTILEIRGAMEQFDSRAEIQSLQRKVKKLSKMNKLYLRHTHQEATNVAPSAPTVTANSSSPVTEQLKEIQGQWYADMEEMIYLGWINMCLRHELLINQGEGEKGEEPEKQGKIRDESVLENPIGEKAKIETLESCDSKLWVSPKKPRLLHKLKGWAKGKGRCTSECD